MEPPVTHGESDSLLAEGHRKAQELNRAYGHLPASDLIRLAITELFPNRLAVVSSFGTEAALILHFVAEIDKSVPILFMDTLKHFMETLTYRDILIDRFGFQDARAIKPNSADLVKYDLKEDLWSSDPTQCCHIRKVLPLERGLQGFSAWVTGRKRFQTAERATLATFEFANGRIKLNPLANWTPEDVKDAFKKFKLPQHPLFDEGYASIGCSPITCTRRVETGEDQRAGRWAGQEKTECGIHLDYNI